MNDKNFGYLGTGFQQQLLKTLIEDKKFSIIIIDSIDSKYFDGPYFKYLMENIKELYTAYGVIPDYTTLEQKIMKENRDISSKIHIDTLYTIRDLELPNAGFVKETALNFCKQQVLKKSLKEVEEIMNNGNFEEYHKIEEIVQKALMVGSTTDSVVDIFDNVLESLEDDNRVPYPTGVAGIDNLLNGGLAKGELGLFIAPLGIGKSTWLAKVANTAYNVGGNVLHIFFEDNENDIRRKHYTCWTTYSYQEQRNHKQEVAEIVMKKKTSKNFLKLVKLAPFGVSVNDIRSIVRKMTSEGQHIDMLVIDYVDCISSERSIDGDEWKGEGTIMRSLEGMKDEFNIAIWVATQGNRCVEINTLVDVLNKGKIKIKDVNEGDLINTHNGYKRINHVFSIEKQPTYKIITKSGKEINVSSRHFFPTKYNQLKSIESGLSVGDVLLLKK